MNTLTKILIGVIVVFMAVTSYLFLELKHQKYDLSVAKQQIEVGTQNQRALEDKLKMKADSIQVFALMVKNLQSDLNSKDKQYILLEYKYAVVNKELIEKNKPTKPVITKDSIIIPFSAKQGKVSCFGETRYSVKDSTSRYSLDVTVQPTNIKSMVYLDTAKIIKNELYADGVLITDAETVIDSALYIKIKSSNLKPEKPYGFWDRLKLKMGLGYKFDTIPDGKLDLNVGFKYNISRYFDISFVKYITEDKKYLVELEYAKSLREIIGYLF